MSAKASIPPPQGLNGHMSKIVSFFLHVFRYRSFFYICFQWVVMSKVGNELVPTCKQKLCQVQGQVRSPRSCQVYRPFHNPLPNSSLHKKKSFTKFISVLHQNKNMNAQNFPRNGNSTSMGMSFQPARAVVVKYKTKG